MIIKTLECRACRAKKVKFVPQGTQIITMHNRYFPEGFDAIGADPLGDEAAKLPVWLVDILDIMGFIDEISMIEWKKNHDGYWVTFWYGNEQMGFRAGRDVNNHGAVQENGIFDIACQEDMRRWCADELYSRLQQLKQQALNTKPDIAIPVEPPSEDQSSENQTPATNP